MYPSDSVRARQPHSDHLRALLYAPLLQGAAVHPDCAALERFARAIAELLQCPRCALAVLLPNGSLAEEVRIGCEGGDPARADFVTRIGCEAGGKDAVLRSIDAKNTTACEILGRSPAAHLHAVAGHVAAGHGIDLAFLAGWRSAAPTAVELPCMTHTLRVIWMTIKDGFERQAERDSARPLLDALAFPAVIVDWRMRVYDLNNSGRAMLMKGSPLRIEKNDVLSGLSSSITLQLKRAVHDTLVSRAQRMPTNTIVALSTVPHQFAFAGIGSIPGQRESDRVLIITPQMDEVAGAARIAAMFALSWAEERIVARILQGQSPSRIGASLHLTEATVRTYIKRIMLKLRINRQSEMFHLHILTLSPFGTGQRPRMRPCIPPGVQVCAGPRLHEDATTAPRIGMRADGTVGRIS